MKPNPIKISVYKKISETQHNIIVKVKYNVREIAKLIGGAFVKNYVILIAGLLLLMVIIPLIAVIGNPNRINKVLEGDYFKILDVKTGQVFSVSGREYMYGALATEMPPTFHSEALKAQAIAAYTYSAYLREQETENPNPQLKGAHFAANPSEFIGYTTKEEAKARWGKNFKIYWKKITSAVDQVYGKIIVYEEKPIFAAYHAISGGTTEYASVVWGQGPEYLVPVKSDGDLLSPEYQFSLSIPKDEFISKIKEALPDTTLPDTPDKILGPIAKTNSGTVLTVKFGEQSLTGQQMRSIFSLRSANFDLTFSDDNFIFVTRGLGHGVGMSQYGADYLARQGQTYEQILTHYYKGVSIVDVTSLDLKFKFESSDDSSSYFQTSYHSEINSEYPSQSEDISSEQSLLQ